MVVVFNNINKLYKYGVKVMICNAYEKHTNLLAPSMTCIVYLL